MLHTCTYVHVAAMDFDVLFYVAFIPRNLSSSLALYGLVIMSVN